MNRFRITCLLFFPLSTSAQVICALGPAAASYKASEDQRPTSDAMLMAGRVNAAAKTICGNTCPAVIVLRNSTAANVMLIVDSGQGKLVYSPQFFGVVDKQYGDAGVIAVMAHVLGHALDDTLGAAWIKSGWSPELRADSWAGCVLAKNNLGAPDTSAALSALSALASYPSPSHPNWTVRTAAIRTGYIQCGGSGSQFDAARISK
jgi:hypothetical protein